jgi:hypothetical protein
MAKKKGSSKKGKPKSKKKSLMRHVRDVARRRTKRKVMRHSRETARMPAKRKPIMRHSREG